MGFLNETAPRWENHSHSASLRPPCFALASCQQPLAQTAPLARATNLRIKANRVPPPPGFVQEPVPERPQRLALKPSSAQGPSCTGFFLISTKRPFSTCEKLALNRTASRWAKSGSSGVAPRPTPRSTQKSLKRPTTSRSGGRELCLSGRSGGRLLGGAPPGRLSG